MLLLTLFLGFAIVVMIKRRKIVHDTLEFSVESQKRWFVNVFLFATSADPGDLPLRSDAKCWQDDDPVSQLIIF